MRRELDEKLVRSFPLLFADRAADLRRTAMCWGFECGDGWFDIIWRLSEKLEPLIAAMAKDTTEPEWLPRASQVKEKYGELSFYMSCGSDEIFKLCNAAEIESATVCETCGKPGKLRGVSWYYTACDEHTREEDPVSLQEEDEEGEKENGEGGERENKDEK